MGELDREEQKQIVKEAIKEWLDDKAKQFGWFSLKTTAFAILGIFFYLYLFLHGWHKAL